MSDASAILRMHVRPELREPAMLLAFAGWNDAGEAATTALRYVDAAIHTVPLAELDPEEFYDFTVHRPELRRGAGRLRELHWPSNVFRFGSLDASRELVTGLGVEPHLRWRTYCDCILELVSRLGVSRLVLLGAYQAEVVYSQPVQVTGFASEEGALERLGVAGSDYEGPTGIVGALAARLQSEGIPVTSFWAGLPHYINATPNPRGALALLEKVTAHLGFKLDTASLTRRAAEFEERISKLVASDAELSEYVRQLKRREFAN